MPIMSGQWAQKEKGGGETEWAPQHLFWLWREVGENSLPSWRKEASMKFHVELICVFSWSSPKSSMKQMNSGKEIVLIDKQEDRVTHRVEFVTCRYF